MVLHEEVEKLLVRPACRQLYCEECIFRQVRCPLCKHSLTNQRYMICIWKMQTNKVVGCSHCEWQGTELNYMLAHVLEHAPDLKRK